MVAVCQGTKSKNDMIVEAVDQYKDMFVRARANFDKIIAVMINVNSMSCSRLTHIRVFEGILKGMEDQMEVEIMGRAVLLLVGMVALVEAELTGEAVLLLVGMAALLMEAEITGGADILLVALVVRLAETMEVAEEGLRHRQRETLRTLQSLDDRKLQQGRAEPFLVQVKDEVPTAMMVGHIRAIIISFRPPALCCAFVSTRALGCIFLASSRCDPRTWPNSRTSISTIITCSADGTTTGNSYWPQHISAAN